MAYYTGGIYLEGVLCWRGRSGHWRSSERVLAIDNARTVIPILSWK